MNPFITSIQSGLGGTPSIFLKAVDLCIEVKMKAFDCKKCGKCCYGEWGIHVNADEHHRIARFLSITTESFKARYCHEKHGRVYIKTGPDNFCIFFNKEKQCLIHPVKPETCSQWPFYPALVKDEHTWEGARDACPGLNRDITFSEFVAQSKEQKK